MDLRDAWLLVRERKWYVLTVFLITVLLAAVYTFLSTPIYQSQATVQVLRHGPQILRVADVMDNTIATDADFNTQISILESTAIIQNVVSRLSAGGIETADGPVRESDRERRPAPRPSSTQIAGSFPSGSA